MKNNILLPLEVTRHSRYHGDWKAAIDEAWNLSKQMDVGVMLNYVNQYAFKILPTMTQADIDELKTTQIIIGV